MKKMPWQSPSWTPNGSPRNRSSPTFGTNQNNDTAALELMIAASENINSNISSPSITYIPQLIDGACGTMPYSQRSVLQRLSTDLSTTIRLLPTFIQAAIVARVRLWEMAQHVVLALLEISILVSVIPLWLCLPGVVFLGWTGCCCALVMGASWSLNGGRGAVARGVLMRSAPPSETPAAVGLGITRRGAMGHEKGGDDDERWFYVGGMGLSVRSLTNKTLPSLAKLFNRPIEAVHAPTYGLPFDFLILLLQRTVSANSWFSTRHYRSLYMQIRTAVLDKSTTRTVILAHNAGAVTVAQVMHQLYADIPAELMTKVEIYTFGAAAAGFSLPLGGVSLELPAVSTSAVNDDTARRRDHRHRGKKRKIAGHGAASTHHQHAGQPQVHAPEWATSTSRKGPHVEHFAFVNDPFARIGVLRSVHEDLEGRFCGSVFELDCPGAAHHGHHRSKSSTTRSSNNNKSRLMTSLSDYMACLFPEQTHRKPGGGNNTPPQRTSPSSSISSSRTSSRSSRRRRHHHYHHHHHAQHQQQEPENHHHHKHHPQNTTTAAASGSNGILDTIMHIDRDLAEKREFAALAQHSASVRSKTTGQKKRLSWTGLGATAGVPANGNMADGVAGLEMARRGCRECQGHRARDVSWLVKYVRRSSGSTCTSSLPPPPIRVYGVEVEVRDEEAEDNEEEGEEEGMEDEEDEDQEGDSTEVEDESPSIRAAGLPAGKALPLQ